MENREGFWIIASEENKTVWVGHSADCEKQLIVKLKQLEKIKKTGRAKTYSISDIVKDELNKHNGHIDDNVHIIKFNINNIKTYMTLSFYGTIIDKDDVITFRKALATFIIRELYQGYKALSYIDFTEDSIEHYDKYRELIIELLRNDTIKVYKKRSDDSLNKLKVEFANNKNTMYIGLGSLFPFEIKLNKKYDIDKETTITNIEEDKETNEEIIIEDTNQNKCNIEVSEELYNLIQIESISQKISIEAMLKKNISLKTLEIYEIMKEYKKRELEK